MCLEGPDVCDHGLFVGSLAVGGASCGYDERASYGGGWAACYSFDGEVLSEANEALPYGGITCIG